MKLKQKEFFWNLAITGAMTGAQMLQGKGQAEEAQAQSDAQVKAMNAQTAAINKLAEKNPQAGVALAQAKQTAYSNNNNNNMSVLYGIKDKLFAAAPNPGIIKQIGGTISSAFKSNPILSKGLKTGASFAAIGGVTKYLSGKYISHDAEKNGIDLQAAAKQNNQMADRLNNQTQRNYSVLDRKMFAEASFLSKVGNGAKSVFGDKLAWGMGGLSAAGDVMSWQQEKKQLMAMKNQSARPATRSVMSSKPQMQQQRQFGLAAARFGNIAKKVGNLAGNFMGIGGRQEIVNMGQQMVKSAGKNQIQAKVGKFIANNPWKTTLAAGIPIGMASMSIANKVGEGAVRGVTKTLDKKAYAWEDYQNSKVNLENAQQAQQQ